MIVEILFIIIAILITIWILLVMYTKSFGNETDYEMITKNNKKE